VSLPIGGVQQRGCRPDDDSECKHRQDGGESALGSEAVLPRPISENPKSAECEGNEKRDGKEPPRQQSSRVIRQQRRDPRSVRWNCQRADRQKDEADGRWYRDLNSLSEPRGGNRAIDVAEECGETECHGGDERDDGGATARFRPNIQS